MYRCCVLGLTALLLLPTSGDALPSLSHGFNTQNAQLLKVQNADIGANGAAKAVRQATGGRVLKVTRINTNSGPAWRVKVLLKGGRMRVLLVDAASGAIR